jgi:hypothetical protein
LLYGSDRKKVIDSGLVLEDEVRAFPSRYVLATFCGLMLNVNVEDRRKLANRNSQVDDPIVIDPSLMRVLDTYLTANNENVTCLIAKFLYAFLMDSPYLAPHEVDNFILRNEQMLFRRYDWSMATGKFLIRLIAPFFSTTSNDKTSSGSDLRSCFE